MRQTNPNMHPPTKGSALLTALFIMTLVAIVATAMSIRLQLDIYRTRLLVSHDKLYFAAQAVMFWAFTELSNQGNQLTRSNKQGMIRRYPKNKANIYKGVQISGALYDMQSKFNLNNLTDKKAIPPFIHLVRSVYPKMNEKDRMDLALALRDWISTYDLSRGKDAYTSYYLAQIPPYYPSHQLMKSSSEFRLLKNVDRRIDQAIQPFITVLPAPTPININTAPKPVLMSLGDGLTKAQVEELISIRGPEGMKKNQDLGPILKKLNIPNNQITIESQYFLSKAYAKNEDLSLVVYVLLKKEKDAHNKISVHVIRESFNDL